MTSEKKTLGIFGEKIVAKNCFCPKCKRNKTLVRLPENFKCADLICDFCGFLAQVKTVNRNNIEEIPNEILGAAWMPQKERMDFGIYFPLFVVITNSQANYSIFYLSADLQTPENFIERKPLSETAKRAGWVGFKYNLSSIKNRLVRVL